MLMMVKSWAFNAFFLKFKISKDYSETVNWRTKHWPKAKDKRTKGKAMIYNILHRKLNIEPWTLQKLRGECGWFGKASSSNSDKIFQLYHGGEHRTNYYLLQDRKTLSHKVVSRTLPLSGTRYDNFSGELHWLHLYINLP